MRPIKLEVQGFTSFRDQTVVDFADADLFVLTGATGSGKSSLLDAITFALYGSIPRLDDQRMVAPVISKGLLESRVRLDFAVGQSRYTAVRVIKATKAGGATTSEARLEDANGNTVAGNEKELTEHIEGLLGIPFEHFIKCVVLPQGDFADFMHARPKDRQQLLIDLLGLELFDRVFALVGQRKSAADGRLTSLREEISRLVGKEHTEDRLGEVGKRTGEVEKVKSLIGTQSPLLEKLNEEKRTVALRIDQLESDIGRLNSIEKPDGIDMLATSIRKARDAVGVAKDRLKKLVEARQGLQDKLNDLPQEHEISACIQQHHDLKKTLEETASVGERVQERQTASDLAQKALDAALAAVTEAELEVGRVKDAHRVYHLVGALEPGLACPVCLRIIDDVPEHSLPAELSATDERLDKARAAQKSGQAILGTAKSDLAVEKERLSQLDLSARELGDRVSSIKNLPDLEQELAVIRAAKEKLVEANAEQKEGEAALGQAEERTEELQNRSSTAWQLYDEARDRVGDLSPPPAKKDDLSGDWDLLIKWSGEKAKGIETAQGETRKKVEVFQTEEAKLHQKVRDQLAELELEIDDDDPLATCAVELSKLTDLTVQIRQTIQDLRTRRAESHQLEEQTRTAGELSKLLGATRFKRWLMNRVLKRLSSTASRLLQDLSSGAYSLSVDDSSNFVVIDHRNADEKRPIRTLSGGETFLASLALALSLSEHLADMAVGGSAKLEALFLDEGFGALDGETLDVVTTAIEELGASGRMIGIVTHVRDLAERIPVRFEVSKEGNRSSVLKVAS